MGEGDEPPVADSDLIAAHTDVVYVRRDERTREVTAAGPGFDRLVGYEPAAPGQEHLSWQDDIVHPDDRDLLDTVAAGGETFRLTYRVTRSDGETRWVRERGRVLASDDESLLLDGLVTVVTEQEQAQLEPYQPLVENVGDPMYRLDTDGNIQFVNQALADVLGLEKSTIKGKHVGTFIPTEYLDRAERVISELVSGEEKRTITWEMKTEDKNGEVRPVETRTGLVRDHSGEIQGTVGSIRDISERKERERELERYETIIQAVGDPVYTLDAEGKFTFVNDAFVRMVGYSAEEMEGTHASMILEDEIIKRSERHIQELLETDDKQSAKFEISVTSKEGDEIPCELQMALLPFEEEFRGTAGVVRDITERKKREKRLEQFSSVVSHDLRGPLSSILARAELARETDEDEHFEEMERSIRRMEDLIDDLLTLARQGETIGELEEISLESVAQLAWGTIETANADLEVVSASALEADQDRLQEVFENLFRNAVEHGGAAESDVVVQIRVGTLEEGGFYVADDGPGIEPRLRGQIFEHGYTTSQGGTGFGLSIVEQIVTAHGWGIEVTESWAGGARFEIPTTQ